MFPVSATAIKLEEMTATPDGEEKPADVSTSVVAAPPGYVTSRMMLFPVSATTTKEEEKAATPHGLLTLAAAPTPSSWPALPLPASVMTVPLMGTGPFALTVSASACGDAAPCASPTTPHSSTAA